MPTKPPFTRKTDLTIFHPASLGDSDARAFAHAVALARRSQSRLLSVHADGGPDALSRIPRATDLLVRWGALSADAGEGAEQSLGMTHIRRGHDCCAGEPVETLLDASRGEHVDLVVVTTGSHRGAFRVLYGSVAESLAIAIHAPTLFFPEQCKPFVSVDSGRPQLARIVIAAGDGVSAELGLMGASWFADVLDAAAVEVVVVTAGEKPIASPHSVAVRTGTTISVRALAMSVEDAIVETASTVGADLVVMATRGHDSLGDILAGSHTERVLRRVGCPLLSLPIH